LFCSYLHCIFFVLSRQDKDEKKKEKKGGRMAFSVQAAGADVQSPHSWDSYVL
jgi:hypothetical protein